MNIIVHSIEIVAPLLLLVGLGAFINLNNRLSTVTINEISFLVSKVFLPATIFINVYNSNIKEDFDLKLLVFLTFIFILASSINIFYINFFVKDNKTKAVLLQASIRSNCTLFALPLAINIAGLSIAGITSLAAVIVTNLNNLYCIYIFERFQIKNHKLSFILIRVLKHPLTVGLLLGLITQALNIKLPYVIVKFVSDVAKITSPIALIIIGASFIFKQNKETVRHMSLAILYKLVLYPALGLLLAITLGFRNQALVVILALSASPVAINSYLTAKEYDCDVDLANATLVYSYIISLITLPMFISLVKFMNLI
jgi:predicted permease